MLSKTPWYVRFGTWYIGLTVLYGVLVSMGLGWSSTVNLGGYGNIHHGTFIVNFIGLFVPIGPNNFLWFLITPLLLFHSPSELFQGLVSIVIVASIGSLVLFDNLFYSKIFKTSAYFSKLFLILFILLLLTMSSDFSMIGRWQSLYILLGS